MPPTMRLLSIRVSKYQIKKLFQFIVWKIIHEEIMFCELQDMMQNQYHI